MNELEHLQNDLMYNSDLFLNLTNASKSDFYSLYSSVYPSRVWDYKEIEKEIWLATFNS